MVHRAILGSFERFISVLVEKYKHDWPFWLAPLQIIVLSAQPKESSYANEVYERLNEKKKLSVDKDFSTQMLQGKVKRAIELRYNYILVAGERDRPNGTVMVQRKTPAGYSEKEAKTVDSLLQEWKEIEQKHL